MRVVQHRPALQHAAVQPERQGGVGFLRLAEVEPHAGEGVGEPGLGGRGKEVPAQVEPAQVGQRLARQQGLRAGVGEGAEGQVELAQPGHDRCGDGSARAAASWSVIGRVRSRSDVNAGSRVPARIGREVVDAGVAAVLLVAQPEFQVRERRQVAVGHRAGGRAVQPVDLDDEGTQAGVPQRNQSEPVSLPA